MNVKTDLDEIYESEGAAVGLFLPGGERVGIIGLLNKPSIIARWYSPSREGVAFSITRSQRISRVYYARHGKVHSPVAFP